MARQALGRHGERLAAATLEKRGYVLLERNFRCSYGEVDLIARDGAELVFVEVKTRRSDRYGLPEEALTLRKRRKLIEVASYYLDLHAGGECPWRIDVVAIQLNRRGVVEEVRVHTHAVTGESLSTPARQGRVGGGAPQRLG
jgi:putative endonuclease